MSLIMNKFAKKAHFASSSTKMVAFIVASSMMIGSARVWASLSTSPVGFTKANGARTDAVGVVMSFSPPVTTTTGHMRLANPMEKVCIHGKTARSTMVNGTWVSSTATVFGRETMASRTLASGRQGKRRVMVFTFLRTGINMKVSGFSA